jgi:hypothetical protein
MKKSKSLSGGHEMKSGKLIVLILIASVFLIVSSASAAEYAGSEKCSMCHMEKFNDWKTSGHPYKLRPASAAKYAPLPLPKGYTWDDISYVIGGHRWKARYMDKKGYLITADKDGKAMPTQWNIVSGKWVNYKAGEKAKYDCGPCHMTGYKKEGNQDGLEGIVGTWAFPAIHCEECHGPGGEHVKSGDKTKISLETSPDLCGKCHIRGEKGKIPAKDGYIEHHEQYNEYLSSPHAGKLQCTTCHDPHKPARFGIRKGCADCHGKEAEEFKGSGMQKMNVKCIDCHMPKAGKSADAASKWEADVKTHSWKISIDPKSSMFTEDGKFATGILTLDFACLRCHQDRNIEWAASKAKGIHRLGK